MVSDGSTEHENCVIRRFTRWLSLLHLDIMAIVTQLKNLTAAVIYRIRRKEVNKSAWDRLQRNGYHPPTDEIVARIQRDIGVGDSDGFLALWGSYLDESIDVVDCNVVEIGHGGGWYLAQCIRAGCRHAYGLEVSEFINTKARAALMHFAYSNVSLEVVDEHFLSTFKCTPDVVYAITVFQHLPTEVLEEYFLSAAKVMSSESRFYFQTLENDAKTNRRGSLSDVFSISYHPNEVMNLLTKSGLKIDKRFEHHFDDPHNYWAIYKVSCV